MQAASGRPRASESARRRRHLLRLITEGRPWHLAADEARVKPETVLRLLNEPDFAAVAAALLVKAA